MKNEEYLLAKDDHKNNSTHKFEHSHKKSEEKSNTEQMLGVKITLKDEEQNNQPESIKNNHFSYKKVNSNHFIDDNSENNDANVDLKSDELSGQNNSMIAHHSEASVISVNSKSNAKIISDKKSIPVSSEKQNLNSSSTKLRRTFPGDNFEFYDGSDENNGRVGLHNFGNTCYMNSALQCLVHNNLLKNYFVLRDYEIDINKNNPLGTNGVLLGHLADFFWKYYKIKANDFTPMKVKREIDHFTNTFEAYRQHDAQEFFNYLLDVIHEDSNRILKKEYVENIEGKEGEFDYDVARRSWIQFLKRNYSIITDNFIGQFKNMTECTHPDCGYKAFSFDPFTVLSLSVPMISSKRCKIKYSIEAEKYQTGAIMFNFKSSRNFMDLKVSDVIFEFAKRKNISPEKLRLCVKNRNNYTEVKNNSEFLGNVLESFANNDHLAIDELENWSHNNSRSKNGLLINFDTNWILYKDNGGSICSENELYPSNLSPTSYFYLLEDQTVKDLFIMIFRVLFKSSSLYDPYCEYPDTHVYFEGYLSILDKNTQNKHFFEIFHEGSKLTSLDYSQKLSELDIKKEKTLYLNVYILLENQSSVRFSFDSFVDQKYLPEYDLDVIDFSNPLVPAITEDSNIHELLTSFSRPEILDESNKWVCPKCKEEVRAQKTINIYKAPRFLTLHFKRIKKINSRCQTIDFPIELNLEKHLLNEKTISEYEIKQEEFMNTENINELSGRKLLDLTNHHKPKEDIPIYRLYGVVNHYGRQNFGHYTAVCEVDGVWYDFNDECIEEIREDSVASGSAYLLFYKRV